MKRLFADHPEALALGVIVAALFALGELRESRLRFAAIDGPPRILAHGDRIPALLEQRMQTWHQRLNQRLRERLERGRRRVYLISE